MSEQTDASSVLSSGSQVRVLPGAQNTWSGCEMATTDRTETPPASIYRPHSDGPGPLVHRNMSATARSMRDLVNTGRSGGVEMNPPYQRGDVWTTEQRVNLIRSLLLGVPVAALVLNQRGSNTAWQRNEGDPGDIWYAVIDGKQRLTTMRMWWDGELAIPAHWLEERMLGNHCLAMVTVNDLSDIGRRFLDNRFIIPVAEARLGSLAEEAEVYMLINSAGTAQTAADLARAAGVSR